MSCFILMFLVVFYPFILKSLYFFAFSGTRASFFFLFFLFFSFLINTLQFNVVTVYYIMQFIIIAKQTMKNVCAVAHIQITHINACSSM